MNYKYSIVTLFFITFLSLPAMDQGRPQSFGECVEFIAESTQSNSIGYPTIQAILAISNSEAPFFVEKHKQTADYERFQELDLSQFIENLETHFNAQNQFVIVDSIQSKLALHNRTVIFTPKQLDTRPDLQKQLSPSKDQLQRQPSLSMLQKKLTYHQQTENADKIARAQQNLSSATLLDNTKNYRCEQLAKQQLAEKKQKELNEQFQNHIETIDGWNAQEECDSPGLAGGAVSRIAESIELFAQLPSYKDFQKLELSKLLAVCGKFNHYTRIPTTGMSKLQEIQDALAPHNTSAKLPDEKQPIIIEHPSDNSMLEEQGQAESSSTEASSFAKASADTTADKPLETITETSEETQMSDDDRSEHDQATDSEEQINAPAQQDQSDDPTAQEQLAIPTQDKTELTEKETPQTNNEQQTDTLSSTPQVEQQLDNTLVENGEPTALASKASDITTDKQGTPEVTQQPEQQTQDSVISNSTEKQKPQETTMKSSFYKKPFFWGMSICTLLAVICCHKHYKEFFVEHFSNPSKLLSYLRTFLSPTAT